MAFTVVSAGPDSLRVEYQVQDGATGNLVKSLRPVRVARGAEDEAWAAALDGLRSIVAMIASPLLGPIALPLRDPPKYVAVRELLTGLQVGRGTTDTTAGIEMIRRLGQAVALDPSFLQARLWRAATRTDRASLSYQLPVLMALRDTVRELDRLRDRMTPFEAALLGWLQGTAGANQVARLLGCPYRLEVRPLAVEQPYPNLVDAAVARVNLEEWVDTEVPTIGEPAGIRDLQLGDRVHGRSRDLARNHLRPMECSIPANDGGLDQSLPR